MAPPNQVVPLFDSHDSNSRMTFEKPGSVKLQTTDNFLLIALGKSGQAAVQHGLSALEREAQLDLNKVRLLVISGANDNFNLDNQQIFRVPMHVDGQLDIELMGNKLQMWSGDFKSPRVYFCVDLNDLHSCYLPLLAGCLALLVDHFGSFPNRTVLVDSGSEKGKPWEILTRLREYLRFSRPEIKHNMLMAGWKGKVSVPELFDDLFFIDQQAEAALGEFLFCLLHPSGAVVHQQLNNLRTQTQASHWAKLSSISIKTNKKEVGRLKAWTAWQAVDRILFGFDSIQDNKPIQWDGLISRSATLPGDMKEILNRIPKDLPFGWFFEDNLDFSNLPPAKIINDRFHKSFAGWLRYALNSCLMESGYFVTRQNFLQLCDQLNSMKKKLGAQVNERPEIKPLYSAVSKIMGVSDAIKEQFNNWHDLFQGSVDKIKGKSESEIRSLINPESNLVNEFIQENKHTLPESFDSSYLGRGEFEHKTQVASLKWLVSDENQLKLLIGQEEYSVDPNDTEKGWLAVLALYRRAELFTTNFSINQSGKMTAADRDSAVSSLSKLGNMPFLTYAKKKDDAQIKKWSIVFSPPDFVHGLNEQVFGNSYVLNHERQDASWEIPRFTAVGIHYGIPIDQLGFYQDAVKSYYKEHSVHILPEEAWAQKLEIEHGVRQFYSAQVVHTLWNKNLVLLFLRTYICGLIQKSLWQDHLAWGIGGLVPFVGVQLSAGAGWDELWNAYENFTVNYIADVSALVEHDLAGENGKNPFSSQNRINYWNTLVEEVNSTWNGTTRDRFLEKDLPEMKRNEKGEKLQFLIRMLEAEVKKSNMLDSFSEQ